MTLSYAQDCRSCKTPVFSACVFLPARKRRRERRSVGGPVNRRGLEIGGSLFGRGLVRGAELRSDRFHARFAFRIPLRRRNCIPFVRFGEALLYAHAAL